MSLAEIQPALKDLSYSDKLLLLHLLAEELLKEFNLTPLNPQNIAAGYGLHDSFEAAAVLAKALEEAKAAPHD